MEDVCLYLCVPSLRRTNLTALDRHLATKHSIKQKFLFGMEFKNRFFIYYRLGLASNEILLTYIKAENIDLYKIF